MKKRETNTPKPADTSNALLAALREMVRQAENAGQRDQPHVVKAREAIALADEGKD